MTKYCACCQRHLPKEKVIKNGRKIRCVDCLEAAKKRIHAVDNAARYAENQLNSNSFPIPRELICLR